MKAISCHRSMAINIVFSNMLEFVLPLKLRKNWLVSWKSRKVYEQNEIRLITTCCELNILLRLQKFQFDAFRDGSTGPDEPKY